MKKHWICLIMVLAPIAGAQEASQSPTMVRVLAPTVARSTPGAFGSVWITEFAVLNGNAMAAAMEYARACPSQCSDQVQIDPGAYRDINDVLNSASGAPGVLVYVPSTSARLMEFSLRVRNLAVQALTFGAEVPVVREENAFTRAFSILNVPIDTRFRHTLRVYDFIGVTGFAKVEYLSI